QTVAGVDVVALLDVEVLPLRDQVFLLLPGVRGDDELLHTAAHAAELHAPVDFRNGRGVLRLPCFKQLAHARQTARDIARLRDLAPDLDHRLAGGDLLPVAHQEARSGRERIARHTPIVLADDID